MAVITTITLATATPGGGFPLYGGVVADVINAVDPTLHVECRNTKGSTENVPLLEASQADIGLVQGEVAIDAFAKPGQPQSGLKIVAAMYATAGMFVVRGDSPAHSIGDLKGKPVAFGARGSGLVILARYVLDGMGLDIERDFIPIYLDRAGDGPAMVLDGRAAALWGGGIGWPGFTNLAEKGGRFLTSTSRYASTNEAHAFLFAGLDFGLRLRRKLQHACRLALAQQGQQHGAPVGKLERIVMRGQLLFVDLAEDRSLMVDGLGLPAEQAGRQASNLTGECQFGAWQQTHRHTEIVGGGEATRTGAEITRHQLVADFRGSRPHALEAKVTHWRLLSPGHVIRGFHNPPEPSGNESKQE